MRGLGQLGVCLQQASRSHWAKALWRSLSLLAGPAQPARPVAAAPSPWRGLWWARVQGSTYSLLPRKQLHGEMPKHLANEPQAFVGVGAGTFFREEGTTETKVGWEERLQNL